MRTLPTLIGKLATHLVADAKLKEQAECVAPASREDVKALIAAALLG